MRKAMIALLALTALLGAACGGGDDDGGSGASGGATGSEGCSAETATDLSGDDPFTITIHDLAFDPACFTAASASAITIENQDSVTHTFTIDDTPVDVTIEGGQTFDGASAGLEAGSYPFHCKIHSSMTGTVFVT